MRSEQDVILRSFLPVVIGSTYKVQPGDTLARIAARLRTTVKKILEVNPDMHSPEIEPNQVGSSSLAPTPCTCAHHILRLSCRALNHRMLTRC